MNYLESRLSGITVQQMQIFLEAAKTENISLAAEKFHMAQATASRNISSLEQSLQLLLFTRSKKRIHLTEVGVQLVKDFQKILNTFDNSVNRAKEMQEQIIAPLRIGDYNSTRCDDYLISIVDRYKTKASCGRLIVERKDPAALYEGLLEGYYDGVFYSVLGREKLISEGFEYKQISKLYPHIVFSARHRLSKKADICVNDFATEPIVIMGKHYIFYWKFIEKLCTEYGLHPQKFVIADNPHSMVFDVMAGNCMAIVDSSHIMFNNTGVKTIKLCENPMMGYGFAYKKDSVNPSLRNFTHCL